MNQRSAPVARGDLVAVISPSGPSPAEHIHAGVTRIAARYRVQLDHRACAARGYLAGSDRERADALLDALRDRSVRAVICTRGGFGATRMIEQFSDEIERALRADPKPIVGFSDVTALHALWAKVGVRSVHGAMVARIGTPDAVDDEALAQWFDAVEGRTAPMQAERFASGGAFEGRAAGGNLAVLAALAGTPDSPRFEGCAVFLEDVGERPYRVDRMLTQLRASGGFAGVAGFVLGEWRDCGPGPDGATVDEVLVEGLRPIGAPVVLGAPFGHGERNAPFELGARVSVSDACRLVWSCDS
jgi:muramoyltetrapeptide carboxypeptidase